MENLKYSRREPDYPELIAKLEKASESLSFYKSNKEICMRDLQKLELENSALAEENDYLKKRIKNAERNVSLMLNKSTDRLDTSQDFPLAMSFVSAKEPVSTNHSYRPPVPPIKLNKKSDNAESTADFKKKANPLRLSYTTKASATPIKKEFDLHHYAIIQHALFLHV